MALPYRLLYRDYAEALGGLREDFFAEMMRHSELSFFYLKNTRGAKTPDYLLNDQQYGKTVIEIGGKGKGISQFKDVKADRKYIFTHSTQTDHIRRPLFMLGFLS